MQPTNRTVLASYPRYADAQAAVDALSDAKYPVENVSIVGRDLQLVEVVTGRLNWGRAALGGVASGAWFGLLFGLFLGIFVADDGESLFALALWGLLFGALAGLVFGLGSYAATGGRRDFVSVSSLVAGAYDVVTSGNADDARRILGGAAGSGAAASVPPAAASGPASAASVPPAAASPPSP